ncbi:SDR family NAD(P)-dependent oxidoreductase [Nocardioides mangrovi]|uniref:SDR family NAD(P)-dependent oxidoreductase n=1 Tax=Nocardioides mangrovi TaxID=2874580 RepID=A0ABS7U9Y0_9ACTN|nr:SDR family NAD(P)-dependent oxidoreductase [Nocardioides mangrovi]MBZ5737761.1 SDR family NAD(P)-dependent oxidoreductase [Nocardioides mangrovi]
MANLATTFDTVVDTALDRTVAPGYTRLGLAVRRRLPGWPADPEPGALDGRRAVVTGASSGLGIATAEGLAALGAEVVLVVRDLEKGARVVREVQGRLPLARLELRRCDLADLDDVRALAAEVDGSVDVLVHNAGAMPPERTESPQGHELTMALHVLTPVLLTDLLAGAGRLDDARVVLVTSGGMYAQRLRADDPEYLDGDYSPTTAYARSKRAQVELLPELQSRWAAHGVTVHATHPGWADTPGVSESLPTFRRITGPLLRDADEGADTTVWLAATEPTPAGGRLWHDRRPRPAHLLRRTRTGEAERTAMWAWVRGAVEG